jgi:uncharacterized protein YbaP (TraB family)
MSSKTRAIITLTLVVAVLRPIAAQTALENSMFWEVSGNGLSQPSWLFGTFHLAGKSHVDTLANVMDKFNQSTTFAGEVVFDSTAIQKMMVASRLQGTTLDRVLSPDLYQQTDAWIKELSGNNLQMFNEVNPITVQIFLMMLIQQKNSRAFDPYSDPAMDVYFQQAAHTQGKTVMGLETIDTQIDVIYHQFTNARQAELLAAYVADKDKLYGQMSDMNRQYFQGNLTALEGLMDDEYYKADEIKRMLDDRNNNWMRQLPTLFKQQRTFVAVGAMHLAGAKGLIAQLRQLGYQVRPLPLQ